MPTLQQTTAVETIAILQNKAIVIYKSYPRNSREQTEQEKDNLKKGASGKYNGYMSPATAKKVKNFLSTWLTSIDANIQKLESGTRLVQSKYYPTFVTLTLPAEQIHEDNDFKRKALDRFLLLARRKFGVMYNFWRAEVQKNGNIHFHIVFDKYVQWKAIREEWNHILDDLGYIELYRQNQKNWHCGGFKLRPGKWSEEKQRAAYEEGIKTNWSNPNSTDIHQIKNVKNLAAYVVKYVCKTDLTVRKLKGRIWGCSDALRNLRPFRDTVCVSESFVELGNPEMVNYLEQVEKATPDKDIFEDEYVKVIRLQQPQEVYLKRFSFSLYKKYKSYYKSILADLYSLPIFEQQPEIIPESIPF